MHEFLHVLLIVACYSLMAGFGLYFLLLDRDRDDDEDRLRPAAVV